MHPFEAMAEPVRRRIIDVLASGEHTSGQLAEVVGMEFRVSRSAVSRHLGILRDAELVSVRGELNWRWYRINRAGFAVLEDVMRDLTTKLAGAAGWDEDHHRNHDPLAVLPVYGRGVFREHLGREENPRGKRGRQTVILRASDPEDGP